MISTHQPHCVERKLVASKLEDPLRPDAPDVSIEVVREDDFVLRPHLKRLHNVTVQYVKLRLKTTYGPHHVGAVELFEVSWRHALDARPLHVDVPFNAVVVDRVVVCDFHAGILQTEQCAN